MNQTNCGYWKSITFKGRCISFFHGFTEISSSLWCGRQPNESSTSIIRYVSWSLIVDMIYWKKWVFSTNIEHVSANLIPLPLNQKRPLGGNSTYASTCSKVVCLCVQASRFNHWTYLHQIGVGLRWHTGQVLAYIQITFSPSNRSQSTATTLCAERSRIPALVSE